MAAIQERRKGLSMAKKKSPSTAARDSGPQIGIDAKARAAIAEGLSGVLADTYLLTIKTHIVHWNIVGPLFYSVHKLTEEQYTALFAATDIIAERIRHLGHQAPVHKNRQIVSGDVDISIGKPSATEMISELVKDHEAAVRKLRDVALMAEEKKDIVTNDLLIERMTFHAEAAWMLRSMLAEGDGKLTV